MTSGAAGSAANNTEGPPTGGPSVFDTPPRPHARRCEAPTWCSAVQVPHLRAGATGMSIGRSSTRLTAGHAHPALSTPSTTRDAPPRLHRQPHVVVVLISPFPSSPA